ncbi:hypothetical protein PIB30_053116 [Stylosanthes scabra]|uniref:Leucine-rich repeat-containing N-terminal plant-type domain-containing protein n=1 Tax=Stylosanthes scabra TaxID=79078 RepID=A0ABU6WL63_9FABA|nr:hypothetical protein [Stylosanthes scabra]
MRLLWLLLLSIHHSLFSSSLLTNSSLPFNHSTTHHECHKDESTTLLQFKHSFVINNFASHNPFSYPKTASWIPTTDCCYSWHGVECEELTGHVIGIDLSSSQLHGSLDPNSSLFQLRHLQELDLSDNDFNNSQIPARLYELSQLKYLNLSQFRDSTFSGEIPPNISQLSNLLSLDLCSYKEYFSKYSDSIPLDPTNNLKLKVSTLRSLIQNSSRLEVLCLDFVTISSSLPLTVTNLTYLQKLSLFHCGLHGDFSLDLFLKLKMLNFLSLSYNNLSLITEKASTNVNVTLPPIQVLRLGLCNLGGEIPSWIMNLTNLHILDLHENNLEGEIPRSLFRLENLESLSLRHNLLQGQLKLQSFLELKNLALLELSHNRLSLLNEKGYSNVTLPPIQVLGLNSCNLSGEIPSWIMNLSSLYYLSLQQNNLQGEIPHSLFKVSNLAILSLESNSLEGELELDMFFNLKKLYYLSLSFNSLSLLTGKGSSNVTIPQFQLLDLASCNLVDFPSFLQDQDNLASLDMSFNDLKSIPSWMWRKTSLQNLVVTGSSLTGEISTQICNLKSLVYLELSDNNLSGTIPSCLGSLSKSLQVLFLNGNKLVGSIPQTYMTGCAIGLIDFSNNSLQGELPRAMVNCIMLKALDVSHNQINDSFPFWLGALPELEIIALRYNRFYGAIDCPSPAICPFPKLHVLDLSHNMFSGKLTSETVRNWKCMMASSNSQLQNDEWNLHFAGKDWFSRIYYSFSMSNKGVTMDYTSALQQFYSKVAIDISCNRISGEIPVAMGELKSLVLLNLSHNMFSGEIPSCLGNLSNLEALDLSLNNLSGKIPTELTELTFLEFFNVSFNELSGPIPETEQFSTFDGKSFEGNQALCGIQLIKKCDDLTRSPPPESNIGDQDSDSKSFVEFDWKIILISYVGGVVVGVALGSAFWSDILRWGVKRAARQKSVLRWVRFAPPSEAVIKFQPAPPNDGLIGWRANPARLFWRVKRVGPTIFGPFHTLFVIKVPELSAAVEDVQKEFVFISSSKDIMSASTKRSHNKRCAVNTTAEEGKSVTPQWAPSDRTHDHADVELSGYGESPDGSQHKRDL